MPPRPSQFHIVYSVRSRTSTLGFRQPDEQVVQTSNHHTDDGVAMNGLVALLETHHPGTNTLRFPFDFRHDAS
jgi:hypothetical protein